MNLFGEFVHFEIESLNKKQQEYIARKVNTTEEPVFLLQNTLDTYVYPKNTRVFVF